MTQPIIDAHHHLWAPVSDPDDLGYVWLRDIGAMKPFGDPTPIQRDYLLDEFLAEPAPLNLSGSVHVQCDPRLPDPVRETAFIQRISDAAGFPIMIVAFADLADSRFARTLARHRVYKNLRGIRQIISYLPDHPELSFAPCNLLDNPIWQDNFVSLKGQGLSFDLQLYPQQMEQAAEFLSQHRDIPVVIDHLGSPYDATDAGLATWRRGMGALADLDHVLVKLSGSAMFFGPDLGAVPRFVTQETFEMFGAARTMFGSNFPVDRLHLKYGDLLAFLTAVAGGDAPAVLHDAAAAFYRF